MVADGLLVGTSTGLFLIGAVFLIALAILWFCLPFAVFGSKPLLRNILSVQTKILAELKRQADGTAKPKNPNIATSTLANETVTNPTDIVTCAACGKETYGGQATCPHCKQPLRIKPIL